MKTTPQPKVKRKFNSILKQASLALTAVLLTPAMTGMAQTHWLGGAGAFNWNNSALWDGQFVSNPGNPNCTDDQGTNNVVLIQDGDDWQHGDTLAGNAAGTGGAYLQTGGTNENLAGTWCRMAVADNSFGYYTFSNGVYNGTGQTHIGEGNNAVAEMTIAGGDTT